MPTGAVKVNLVTIICGNELENRVVRELTALGVFSAYTRMEASGRGTHGSRKFGMVDGANTRIELLVTPEHATKIIEFLAANYVNEALIAYTQDVMAVSRKVT